MNAKQIGIIKKQILAALSHPEAEDGLYFNNLIVVHEEEERPIVEGEEAEIKSVLDTLVSEGTILRLEPVSNPIFKLPEEGDAL